MPKARKSSTDQDIKQVSVAQLARLTAEILLLHLASHHLLTTGMKATMAQWLYDAIPAPDAPAQQHSIDSATVMLHQHSDDPASSQQQGTQQQQDTHQQQHTQQQQSTQLSSKCSLCTGGSRQGQST